MINKTIIAGKYVHIMNRVYAKTGIKLPGFKTYTNRLKAELEKSSHIKDFKDVYNKNKICLNKNDKLTEELKTFERFVDDVTKYFFPEI